MSLRLILIHFIYRFVFGVGIAAIVWVGAQFVYAKAYHPRHAIADIQVSPQSSLRNGVLVREVPRRLETTPSRDFDRQRDNGTAVDPFLIDFTDLRIGDRIQFSTPGGTFGYFVTTLEIIDPSKPRIPESPGQSELTIIASPPIPFAGAAPQQFVVQARPRFQAKN